MQSWYVIKMTAKRFQPFATGYARVPSHARSYARHRHTTIAEHMPSAHRRYAEWTPTRMMPPLYRISTVVSVMRASSSSRMRREGTK